MFTSILPHATADISAKTWCRWRLCGKILMSVFVIPRGKNSDQVCAEWPCWKIFIYHRIVWPTASWNNSYLQRSILRYLSARCFYSSFWAPSRGVKKLMIPKVSFNFVCNGKDVVSLCSNTCLYIMARRRFEHRWGCAWPSCSSLQCTAF